MPFARATNIYQYPQTSMNVSIYNLMSLVVGETMNVMRDVEELISCLIQSQESVIKLQRELLEAKTGGGEKVFEESRSDIGAVLCK